MTIGESRSRREFAVLTQRFSGEKGKVKTLHCVHVDGKMQPIVGSEFQIKADLMLLAMAFVHPAHEGLLKDLGINLDERGNARALVLILSPILQLGRGANSAEDELYFEAEARPKVLLR